MLKSINRVYLLSAIFLYLILSIKISGEYLFINLFTIFSFLSYFIILDYNTSINKKYYTNYYLLIETFIYISIFIIMQNLISYFYNNNFFVFNESDAVFYHYSASKISTKSFIDGMEDYLTHMGVDDLGMMLVLYPLYQIYDSNLMLNFLYIFVGTITALSIFRISKKIMLRKYAFLSALAYSISSFVLYFHSTGLKESFMVMLVILSFDFYYQFLLKRKFFSLLVSLIFIVSLFLFRPILAAMIIGAIGMGTLFSKKGGVGIKIISFIIFIVLIVMGDSITEQVNSYTTGGIDTLIKARESQGGIIGGIFFTYVVNVLSQTIGPLPTIISSSKVGTMFYASGLIYRVLLAFPFWLGIVHIYKTKSYILYPLAIFTIIEMSALAYLIDGLELRKALPHIPIVFIIAFWFMDKYDRKLINFKRKKRFKQFYKLLMFLLTFIIFYWNFR